MRLARTDFGGDVNHVTLRKGNVSVTAALAEVCAL